MSETVMKTDAAAYVPTAKDFCLKNNTKEFAIDTNSAAQSLWKETFTRSVRKKSTVVGLILTASIVVLAAVGPKINAYSYSVQSIAQKNSAPHVPGFKQFEVLDGSETTLTVSGSKKVNGYREKELDNICYQLGSGNSGRDLWTRTWSGACVSLMIAIVIVMIDMLVNMSYGLVSGYFGGKVDIIMQRILEILNGIPRLVIVMLLLLVLKSGVLTTTFVLAPTEWTDMNRIARAEVLKSKEQEFVLVSRTPGAGPFFIIFKETLPNIIGLIVTQVTFSVPATIFIKAFLSSVGLGISAPKRLLDSLISDSSNPFTMHSFQVLSPITVIALLILNFNLVGDGLREALDLKPKGIWKGGKSMSGEKILDIRDPDITFQTTMGAVYTIRDVNIDFYRREVVAIIGEPGSGKFVTVCVAMGILTKNAVTNHGNIEFCCCRDDGMIEKVDVFTKDKKWIQWHINGERIAIISQGPMTSLDPAMQIGRWIMEGMIWHYHMPKKETYRKVARLLGEAGTENAEKCMKVYSHQLSGGMRQRVATTTALVYNPDLLIYDKSMTVFDITIQAKIIELIRRVQKERGLLVTYITHDLGAIAKVVDYVSVAYVGKIIEKGKSDEISYDPRHPHTQGLLSVVPDLDTGDDRLCMIPGFPPNLLHRKAGDAFTPRNMYALVIDDKLDPPTFQITDSHCTTTWLLDPRVPRVEIPTKLKRKIERVKKETEQYGDEL